MKDNSGFTLIELLVAVAILAILVAFAIPNFTDTTARSRLAANANEVLGAIQLARAEALRRNGAVSLAPLDGADWSNGFAVYIDAGGTANAYDDGEEIRIFENFGRGTTIATVGASTNIIFDSRGFANSNGAGAAPSEEALRICDDRPAEVGRLVNLLVSGATWVADANDCN
ncbi:GspH/FimT family pseudopilin [Sessilibacter sp. MAH2]